MPADPALTPLTLRLLRLLSHVELRSGRQLARTLGVSRNSVWQALSGVEAAGVGLIRVRGRGYRLTHPVDWLDATCVREHLGAHSHCFDVRMVDVVDSTSTALLAQASGDATDGMVLAAEFQRHGRGRRGRAWYGGIGGALTFSVLWRFEQVAGLLAGLGPAVGVALVRALRDLGVAEAMLKWPNDVLVGYRKLAGTLVEIQGDVLGPSLAVVGVGLNCRLDSVTRQHVDQAVTDLRGTGVSADRSRVLAAVLVHLAEVRQVFAQHGFAPLRREWERYHVYAHRPVTLRLPDGSSEEGTVAGVDDDGSLLLQTSSGLRRFHSAEVSLRAVATLSPLLAVHRR